jgi:DNA topoisomerase-1
MARPLVIVESPAKAKTIAKFLGSDYVVESSIGHIRDLPRGAADIPAAYKAEPWSRLGVDTQNDFKPLYVVAKERKDQVRKLKDLIKESSELYLATDEDREGESIAWHLLEVLSPRIPVKRMVFHEITERAIQEAVDHTRELDRRLVDAQETRRILDRLFGYEISPVLWRKIRPQLSAGRVQSVACRVLVERERARMEFITATYFDVSVELRKEASTFQARLSSIGGRRVVGSKDFSSDGELNARARGAELVLLDEPLADTVRSGLEHSNVEVVDVEEKPYKRSPSAPFMTSTLQQEAGRKLRFSSQRTMSVAQRLYETGYITYMRTDSISLATTAVDQARRIAAGRFGAEAVAPSVRHYRSKVKNAQEAHEAIRPAGDTWKTPEQVSRELSSDEARLYELIWKRTVASQMADAVGRTISVRLEASLTQAAEGAAGRFEPGTVAQLVSSGRVITSPGFLSVYVEDVDDAESDDEEGTLPRLSVGDRPDLTSVVIEGHETQPPARFTEASLVKRLEELGVGRPSTYASIISTILDRGYAWKKGQALVPSFLAFAVVGLLEQHFPNLVDYSFTAEMENSLDQIAEGSLDQVPYLTEFYFGEDTSGLKTMVENKLGEIDARSVSSIPIGATEDGQSVVVRVGKYGPFVQIGERTASLPEDLSPDELTVSKALELVAKAEDADRVVGVDPATGKDILVKVGRFGPYVQVGEIEEGSKQKPKTASLLAYMDPSSLTLEDALSVLSLPRLVGEDPETGESIYAQGGRFGPYLSRGKDTRSLESDRDIFTVTLDGAQALFAQPKTRRRAGAAGAASATSLGVDEGTGRSITVRSGRFGPYVTDGEVNASLPRGVDPETLGLEQALDLLAERRIKLASAPQKPKAKRSSTKRRT